MATERQILNRKRNWNVLLVRGILSSISRIQKFFAEQNDGIGLSECDRCSISATEILKILKGYKI